LEKISGEEGTWERGVELVSPPIGIFKRFLTTGGERVRRVGTVGTLAAGPSTP